MTNLLTPAAHAHGGVIMDIHYAFTEDMAIMAIFFIVALFQEV